MKYFYVGKIGTSILIIQMCMGTYMLPEGTYHRNGCREEMLVAPSLLGISSPLRFQESMSRERVPFSLSMLSEKILLYLKNKQWVDARAYVLRIEEVSFSGKVGIYSRLVMVSRGEIVEFFVKSPLYCDEYIALEQEGEMLEYLKNEEGVPGVWARLSSGIDLGLGGSLKKSILIFDRSFSQKEQEKTMFSLKEYQENKSWWSGPRLTFRQRADIVVQLELIMAKLQEEKIVHGHITPDDILIKQDAQGHVQVLLINFDQAGKEMNRRVPDAQSVYEFPHFSPTYMHSYDCFAVGLIAKDLLMHKPGLPWALQRTHQREKNTWARLQEELGIFTARSLYLSWWEKIGVFLWETIFRQKGTQYLAEQMVDKIHILVNISDKMPEDTGRLFVGAAPELDTDEILVIVDEEDTMQQYAEGQEEASEKIPLAAHLGVVQPFKVNPAKRARISRAAYGLHKTKQNLYEIYRTRASNVFTYPREERNQELKEILEFYADAIEHFPIDRVLGRDIGQCAQLCAQQQDFPLECISSLLRLEEVTSKIPDANSRDLVAGVVSQIVDRQYQQCVQHGPPISLQEATKLLAYYTRKDIYPQRQAYLQGISIFHAVFIRPMEYTTIQMLSSLLEDESSCPLEGIEQWVQRILARQQDFHAEYRTMQGDRETELVNGCMQVFRASILSSTAEAVRQQVMSFLEQYIRRTLHARIEQYVTQSYRGEVNNTPGGFVAFLVQGIEEATQLGRMRSVLASFEQQHLISHAQLNAFGNATTAHAQLLKSILSGTSFARFAAHVSTMTMVDHNVYCISQQCSRSARALQGDASARRIALHRHALALYRESTSIFWTGKMLSSELLSYVNSTADDLKKCGAQKCAFIQAYYQDLAQKGLTVFQSVNISIALQEVQWVFDMGNMLGWEVVGGELMRFHSSSLIAQIGEYIQHQTEQVETVSIRRLRLLQRFYLNLPQNQVTTFNGINVSAALARVQWALQTVDAAQADLRNELVRVNTDHGLDAFIQGFPFDAFMEYMRSHPRHMYPLEQCVYYCLLRRWPAAAAVLYSRMLRIDPATRFRIPLSHVPIEICRQFGLSMAQEGCYAQACQVISLLARVKKYSSQKTVEFLYKEFARLFSAKRYPEAIALLREVRAVSSCKVFPVAIQRLPQRTLLDVAFLRMHEGAYDDAYTILSFLIDPQQLISSSVLPLVELSCSPLSSYSVSCLVDALGIWQGNRALPRYRSIASSKDPRKMRKDMANIEGYLKLYFGVLMRQDPEVHTRLQKKFPLGTKKFSLEESDNEPTPISPIIAEYYQWRAYGRSPVLSPRSVAILRHQVESLVITHEMKAELLLFIGQCLKHVATENAKPLFWAELIALYNVIVAKSGPLNTVVSKGIREDYINTIERELSTHAIRLFTGEYQNQEWRETINRVLSDYFLISYKRALLKKNNAWARSCLAILTTLAQREEPHTRGPVANPVAEPRVSSATAAVHESV